MVAEKEGKLREVLSIMGMRAWPLAASWAVAYGCVFSLVSVLGEPRPSDACTHACALPVVDGACEPAGRACVQQHQAYKCIMHGAVLSPIMVWSGVAKCPLRAIYKEQMPGGRMWLG